MTNLTVAFPIVLTLLKMKYTELLMRVSPGSSNSVKLRHAVRFVHGPAKFEGNHRLHLCLCSVWRW